jgi:outer membrane protein OmpA-like peptidoglycan-associated protein
LPLARPGGIVCRVPKPFLFLAFANDRQDDLEYLRNLPFEAEQLRRTLDREPYRWGVILRSNATASQIFEVFQDARYRGAIAVFHYGGHADCSSLLLEDAKGRPAPALADGLAAFLGQQQGLRLVFLNGCSTSAQAALLHEAGVTIVVTTSTDILDDVAIAFAGHFYHAFAHGAGVASAFAQAEAAVRSSHGKQLRRLRKETNAAESSWPWHLSFKPGSEEMASWSLADAIGDPLWGLPAPPRSELPPSPFRHLLPFGKEHCELFFGRGAEIRAIYDRLTTAEAPPILLVYGQTGVGKSSLLASGLIPRLESTHEVRAGKRPDDADLPTTVRRLAQAASDRPTVLVLDQLEEVYTKPRLSGEFPEFVQELKRVIGDGASRSRTRVVLAFRKEWFAEINGALVAAGLPFAKVFIGRLDRSGVMEAVLGPASAPRLKQHFRLQVDDGVADRIATELLADSGSAVAPMLQILLHRMWEEAIRDTASPDPRFTQASLNGLLAKGIQLGDFLDQQIGALSRSHPQAVANGLLLDLLAFHTTELGTATSRSVEDTTREYGGRGEVQPLIRSAIDSYLLVEDGAAPVTGTGGHPVRLVHDTLAPIVRMRIERSVQAGPRARRVLEERAVDWAGGRTGRPFDREDLRLVEAGKAGMRSWVSDEIRLIVASKKREGRASMTRVISVIVLIVTVVALGLLVAGELAAYRAKSNDLALQATNRGQFTINAPPGARYIGARRVPSESGKEPWKPGDIMLYTDQLEVKLQAGYYVLEYVVGDATYQFGLRSTGYGDNRTVALPAPIIRPGFVFVPGGTVPVGDGLGIGYENESPRSPVLLEPYLISREVVPAAEIALSVRDFLRRRDRLTWLEAVKLAEAKGARLPSAAEWEWAATLGVLDWSSYPRFEWTGTRDFPLPYVGEDGRENRYALDETRLVRGGWVTEDSVAADDNKLVTVSRDFDSVWTTAAAESYARPSRTNAAFVDAFYPVRLVAVPDTATGQEDVNSGDQLSPAAVFEPDKSQVKNTDSIRIRTFIARHVGKRWCRLIIITPYTSAAGSWDYSMHLGSRRAADVHRLIVQEGIDPDRIRIDISGADRQSVGASGPMSQLKNRVDIDVKANSCPVG